MLVAVEETATGNGNASQGEATIGQARPGGRRTISLFALRHAAFAAMLVLGVVPALVPVASEAQVVAAGAYAPTVIQTASGIQQVNINAPSGAGVSQNTYSQFDVPKSGIVLNNSPTIVNTQQAGYINGNPNFAPGQSAKIILNQVNSTAASQLRGYVEVAGSKAEVVLANGSGIVVDGGGFINTSRGILTTGLPIIGANGSLAGFNVTGGQITVQGAGLNAANVDQVDLIARAVAVNASIYANNLNVVSGANQVDHDTLAATPIAGNGTAPDVLIDVSQLDGMYANRIKLVGTENSVGVSLAGITAAQAGDLTLTTQGKLLLAGKTNASGNMVLSAHDGIDNSGTTYAQQAVSVNTAGDLTNSGTLAAQQNFTANANNVASTGTLGAGINSDGSIAHAGDLTIIASGTLSATGQNAAGGNAALSGVSMNLAGSQTSANGNLALTASAGDLNLASAKTTAGGLLSARAQGTLDNSAGAITSNQLVLAATNLVNHNGSVTQTGTDAPTVSVSGTFDNANGLLQTNSADLSLTPATLINDHGTISNSGTGTLSIATGSLSNNGGTVATNGALNVQAGAVSNQGGKLAAQSRTTLLLASLDNSLGGYVGAQDVAVTTQGALNNAGGTIEASNALTVCDDERRRPFVLYPGRMGLRLQVRAHRHVRDLVDRLAEPVAEPDRAERQWPAADGLLQPHDEQWRNSHADVLGRLQSERQLRSGHRIRDAQRCASRLPARRNRPRYHDHDAAGSGNKLRAGSATAGGRQNDARERWHDQQQLQRDRGGQLDPDWQHAARRINWQRQLWRYDGQQYRTDAVPVPVAEHHFDLCVERKHVTGRRHGGRSARRAAAGRHRRHGRHDHREQCGADQRDELEQYECCRSQLGHGRHRRHTGSQSGIRWRIHQRPLGGRECAAVSRRQQRRAEHHPANRRAVFVPHRTGSAVPDRDRSTSD